MLRKKKKKKSLMFCFRNEKKLVLFTFEADGD
jgi:hypothetical protein